MENVVIYKIEHFFMGLDPIFPGSFYDHFSENMHFTSLFPRLHINSHIAAQCENSYIVQHNVGVFQYGSNTYFVRNMHGHTFDIGLVGGDLTGIYFSFNHAYQAEKYVILIRFLQVPWGVSYFIFSFGWGGAFMSLQAGESQIQCGVQRKSSPPSWIL